MPFIGVVMRVKSKTWKEIRENKAFVRNNGAIIRIIKYYAPSYWAQ